jgi:hypothetical protein
MALVVVLISVPLVSLLASTVHLFTAVSQGNAAAPLTLGCGIDNNEADSFVRHLTKTAYNQECQRC